MTTEELRQLYQANRRELQMASIGISMPVGLLSAYLSLIVKTELSNEDALFIIKLINSGGKHVSSRY